MAIRVVEVKTKEEPASTATPQRMVAWWSGGATSAVACHLLKDRIDELIFIETGSHHEDSTRFKRDCEGWYGRTMTELQSSKYTSHFDVIEKRRFINGPHGALCTAELKKLVRDRWERQNPGRHIYVWGFEYNAREMDRADRILTTVPQHDHVFPLIDAKITKKEALKIIAEAGIELPMMYKLGFHNNNCIGCVKGGMAYWNLIRVHFPEVFAEMARLERVVGRSCLKKFFLDELPSDAGRGQAPLVQDCGAIGEGCEIQRSRAFWERE